jgi:hypothetical protein
LLTQLEPKAQAKAPSLKLVQQLAEAIEWRLNRAEELIETILEPGTNGQPSRFDRAVDACDQARRQCEQAELDGEVMSILLDDNQLAEARELLSGRLSDHCEDAKRHSDLAGEAASGLTDEFDSATASISQAESLLSLAARPDWHLNPNWLAAAVTRVSALKSRIAVAQECCEAAHENAVMAAAYAVQARVACGLAESDLERAELTGQLAQIEALLGASEEPWTPRQLASE